MSALPCSFLLRLLTFCLKIKEKNKNMNILEYLGSGNHVLEFIGTVVTLGIGLLIGQILIDWWRSR